ncbi:hypothetical protein [Paenibacillus pseudetheri]|uniref:Uncharacterized protein n=1 Tax=Paenibacillus pseudetheri TaxID=2897682 RepID=A0ABN8FN00_9BACL|nr:hypothetical protein [Paenibacillus pseudetheri]CAH1057787.1 hypothetical protein PAECIP111894_03960 [Paenibacillus pseudetheri]
MDSFMILNDNRIYKITRDNFEKLTDKKHPYCQEIRKRMRYLAICPACGNPINFIGLYVKDQTDRKRIRALHGRHFTENVPQLADFDEYEYKDCPFHNDKAGKLYTDIPGQKKNNEIVRLIKTYPEELRECISKILGFHISQNKFEKLLTSFVSSKGYYFEGITKFNLPYYFLYLLPNQKLFKCKVMDNDIEQAIDRKCKYFEVSKEKRLEKKVNEYVEFEFILVEHIKKDESESINYKLIERKKEIRNLIFENRLEINHYLFVDMISGK